MTMEKMGMATDNMDDNMMSMMKNVMMSVSKMAMAMKDKGMSEMEIMEHLKKMSSMMMDKDTIMGMGEM